MAGCDCGLPGHTECEGGNLMFKMNGGNVMGVM